MAGYQQQHNRYQQQQYHEYALQDYDNYPQEHYDDYQQEHYEHYPPQPARQRQYAPPHAPRRALQRGYEESYDQQEYYPEYDQDGYKQRNNGDYDQQGNYYTSQQARNYHPPPPQQHPQHPPRQVQLNPPRAPVGRGHKALTNPHQESRGLRPPGLDRSLLNPVIPKRLPQDNPFPTFPTQKSKPPAHDESVEKSLSHLKIAGNETSEGSKSAPARMPLTRPSDRFQPPTNSRQDSGHFEGDSNGRQLPVNRPPVGQRPVIAAHSNSRGTPLQNQMHPQSPSQRSFNPNPPQSMTLPTNVTYDNQCSLDAGYQQWAGSSVSREGNRIVSPTQPSPRPSTASGTRLIYDHGDQHQQLTTPQPPLQQSQSHTTPSDHIDHHHVSEEEAIDTFYDDYYVENSDRKSVTLNIDMPNFDAIPVTTNKHRRGDSMDNHLNTSTLTHQPSATADTGHTDVLPHYIAFSQQASRSRSQPDLHGQYVNPPHNIPADAPPLPGLPRANTDFERPDASFRHRDVGTQRAPINGAHNQPDPNYPLQQQRIVEQSYNASTRPPPVPYQRYANEATYSEPHIGTMRNISSPVFSTSPVVRPGTAAPAPRRSPNDPLGRRPGTAQPRMNPDSLPAHPAPVRTGLVQQNRPPQASMQARPSQGARPPPVRQYNDPAGANHENQQKPAQRQSSTPHPVTYDELNRLRNSYKSNPLDNAIGLKLAKKLVEAANVLADEGGTADARTKSKNRERFTLEGHKLVKKLVSAGYSEAMFYLADCHGQGLLGLQPDTREAFSLYQSAAKAGHAASAYRTAVCCEMGHEEGGGTKRDPLKAVQWYRRAAALGDTPALYKMGMVLLKGLLGQQKNFGEAINMLKRAADRADSDNPHALHELGLIYEAQSGNDRIIKDEAYALQLFHQAADLGYKFSQFRLGQAYEYGLLGCQIDARTSIAWYTRAAAQEEHQSELALSGWYLTGTQGILEQSDTEAYLWARKAACAEPPLPKALFAMGYFTEVGIGCPRSLDEAKRWYGRAAAYKFPKAQERLEELKRGGSKAQMKRERLSRTNQKQQEENCMVM